MDFLNHVVNSTVNATETFLRYAKAIPKDRMEWNPTPEARSALSMLQEVAQDPRDIAKLFRGEHVPEAGSDIYFERLRREKAEWTTLEECERVLEFNVDLLVKALSKFPADRLGETVIEPWGHKTTFGELAMYQYWNTTWHTGQLAYIQTLLGDSNSY